MHPHSLFFLLGTDARCLLLLPDLLHQLAFHMMLVVIFLFSFGPNHPGKAFEQTECTLNSNRRILTVLVCLALILGLSSPVFATTTQTFFTRTAAGYQCTGSGIVSNLSATAEFDAESPSRAVPPEYATCTILVLARDSEGNLIGAATTNGTLHSSATYISETQINYAYYSFEFCNLDLGGYILYNS